MEFEERPQSRWWCSWLTRLSRSLELAPYKIFADPFNTAGLVIDPKMHKGLILRVHDLIDKKIVFHCPEDLSTCWCL